MRRLTFRFLLGFFAGSLAGGILVVATVGTGSLASTRYQDLSLFSDVLRLVRDNYVEPVDERKLIEGAVRGMLQELDPHSSYLDPEAHKEMQIDTRGEFHGLGIEISKERNGFIIVVSPIEGTPAWRAGIRARDQIVAICPTDPPEDWKEPCRSTKAMDLSEAVRLMRGPKGSEITIRIFREGFDRPQPFKLSRDVVKVASVEGRMLEDGYAYVRVRSFQERTARDLRRVVEGLRKESAAEFDGFVLDLRDNPGGLLDQAVKVADMWLEGGLIVYTQGRVESQQQKFEAVPDGEGEYPMVVLVNAGSASASEIVAGALQDHHRALLLGGETFGKGSVQTVFPLEDRSGLRLTTALYFTPSGRSIQEVGIHPDIQVELHPLEAAEPEEGGIQRFREEDLEGHLTQEEVVPDAGGESAPGEGAAADGTEDVQLTRAIEVLKSWTYFDRLREARADSAPVRSAEAAGGAPAP